MDDETLREIVENDKEWRKYMVHSIEDIRKETGINSKDISSLKTWNIVWRILGFSLFSSLLYVVRGIILK